MFVSDVHLGMHLSNAPAFLEFLQQIQPQMLYLVGDILDGWSLTKRFYWPPVYTQILSRIQELERAGTQLFIVPGNHDDFLRQPIPLLSHLNIAEEFIHETVCGRSLWVTHGDQFDRMEVGGRRISMMGARFFDTFSRMVPRRSSLWVRRTTKKWFSSPDRLAERMTQAAMERQVAGVIFGHSHRPSLSFQSSLLCGNSGDWIQNQSAIIEMPEGGLKLINGNRTVKELSFAAEAASRVDPDIADHEGVAVDKGIVAEPKKPLGVVIS